MLMLLMLMVTTTNDFEWTKLWGRAGEGSCTFDEGGFWESIQHSKDERQN